MIEWLRWGSVLSWLVPVVIFAPSFARWVAWRPGLEGDANRQAKWFVAVVIIGFSARRLFFQAPEPLGTENYIMCGLYALSAIGAQSLTWARN